MSSHVRITICQCQKRRTISELEASYVIVHVVCSKSRSLLLSLDMARYKVQKGPMCQTCVPVSLCRKIFWGKAHRWHVFFVAYDFIYEVFNEMYILFVSYTV